MNIGFKVMNMRNVFDTNLKRCIPNVLVISPVN